MNICKTETNADLNIIDVPVSYVDVHPVNDRRDQDTGELEALAQSILDDGQLTPCLARPIDGGRYQLIFGSRRYHAIKLAGLISIRLDVRELTDQQSIELIGVENIHRRDFNPVELAQYLDRLARPIDEGGAGLDSKYVAARFGKTASWVTSHRRLLRLPQFWQDLVASGSLRMTLALYLVPHLNKEPVMKAVQASFQKNPDAWKERTAFSDQLAFIVSRFEKLQLASPTPLPVETRRSSPPSRKAALASDEANDEYAKMRALRQAEQLTEELDAVTDGVDSMPHVPLSEDQARSMLAKFWHQEADLRLIRRVATMRLNQVARMATA